MRTKLTVSAVIIAAAIAVFAIYPRISAQLDDDASAYQQASQLPGDQAQVELDGARKTLAVATFAGGCFWCVEAGFEKVPGVWGAISGYSGGDEPEPTYEQVARGLTGHTEAVQVYYDPEMISYEGLLQILWRTMDPTDNNGQFSDRGKQYRPAVFYHNEEQQTVAEQSRSALDKSGRFPDPVTIPIEPYRNFFKAEDYHQDYSRKNPLHYRLYTRGSGRAPFVERIWGEDLKLDYSKYGSNTLKAEKSRSDRKVGSRDSDS